jgi:Zn-dependent protease with chaperone function
VKGYRKLTLITAMLGLVILVPFVVGYAYVITLIGLTILGLFLGCLLLYVFLLLIVNIASLYIAFRIKNTKIAGILLILCGVVILASTNYFGIPSFVLFCIAGVLALREKPTFSNLIKKE